MKDSSCSSCKGKIPMATEIEAQLARGERPSPLPSVSQALMPSNLTFDPANTGVAIATYAPMRSAQPPVTRLRQPEIILPRDEIVLIEPQPTPRSRVLISEDFQESVSVPPRRGGQRQTLGMDSGSLPIAQRYTLGGISTFANAEVFGIEVQEKPVDADGNVEEKDSAEAPLPLAVWEAIKGRVATQKTAIQAALDKKGCKCETWSLGIEVSEWTVVSMITVVTVLRNEILEDGSHIFEQLTTITFLIQVTTKYTLACIASSPESCAKAPDSSISGELGPLSIAVTIHFTDRFETNDKEDAKKAKDSVDEGVRDTGAQRSILTVFGGLVELKDSKGRPVKVANENTEADGRREFRQALKEAKKKEGKAYAGNL